MKQRTKKILLTSASMAILGVLLCSTSLALAAFDITRLSVPSNSDRQELVQTYDPADVTRIVIDADIDGITLQPSPDGELQLRCYPGGGYEYNTLVNGTELTIRQQKSSSGRLPSWFQFNFDWNHSHNLISHDLILSIPKNYDGDLFLNLDLGSLEIADSLELTGAIDAKMGLGNFFAETLTARSLTLECGQGDITGRGLQIGQYSYLSTGLGSVSIKDSAAGAMLSCNTGLGDITLSQISVPDTMLNTGAGDVEFHNLTASHIDARSGLGDIEGTIIGVETDYSIDAVSNLGNCNLKARQGLTDKTLLLTCGAGDIQVKFQP